MVVNIDLILSYLASLVSCLVERRTSLSDCTVEEGQLQHLNKCIILVEDISCLFSIIKTRRRGLGKVLHVLNNFMCLYLLISSANFSMFCVYADYYKAR